MLSQGVGPKKPATNGHPRLCLAPPSGGRCPERLRVPL
jgi:hypothetical protein